MSSRAGCNWFGGRICHVGRSLENPAVVKKTTSTKSLNHSYPWAQLGGVRGKRLPNFSDCGDITCHVSHIFLFRFCFWRGFKYKIDVCHVLYEGFFMLDVAHNQVDVEIESGVVLVILQCL